MKLRAAVTAIIWILGLRAWAPAQSDPGALPVEVLGEGIYRLGSITIDENNREVSVPGKVNSDVTVVEFLVNTKSGFRAYESAIQADTDAVSFNAALILIGLDPSNGRPAKFPFDPDPPGGDPVEVWVEWKAGGQDRRVRAEELVYNTESGETLPRSHWVYTGSLFLESGEYLADAGGTLISFAHSPEPVIDSPLAEGAVRWGTLVFNPNLGLNPGMPVKLTVKALAGTKAGAKKEE